MRVIAGALKGRRLKTPAWTGLRPTADKLRETLFNVLAPRIQGARVVDAYAGTGALGIEAISRGARFAAFIDEDRRAEALIAANVAHCGIENVCAIIRAKVARTLETLFTRGGLTAGSPAGSVSVEQFLENQQFVSPENDGLKTLRTLLKRGRCR